MNPSYVVNYKQLSQHKNCIQMSPNLERKGSFKTDYETSLQKESVLKEASHNFYTKKKKKYVKIYCLKYLSCKRRKNVIVNLKTGPMVLCIQRPLTEVQTYYQGF